MDRVGFLEILQRDETEAVSTVEAALRRVGGAGGAAAAAAAGGSSGMSGAEGWSSSW